MKIEKLRKSHKKEMIIGWLIISIVGIVTFSLTRAKYQGIEDIKLVEGNINYKPYDFKMMAMYKSDDGTNYTEIDTMPESGYVINEEKSYCTINNVDKDNNAKMYTNNNEHVIKNILKNDKCYLYFDNATTAKSIDELVNKLSKIAKIESPDFSQTATTDEGVYKEKDGMYGGYSYYWRGAVTTNYVKFGGYCWRIIRINGDGTMRLIYDGTTCHANGEVTEDSIAVASTAYNPSYNKSEYVGWKYTEELQRPNSTIEGTDSPVKIKLEEWYNTNLKNQESKIADGKYCNDRNAASGQSWSSAPSSTFYYVPYERRESANPILSCPSLDTYTLKVGLITSDEVMYAGGKAANNTAYYLYNGQYYWTMSPNSWGDGGAGVFVVTSNGFLDIYWSVYYTFGVRPIINLKADTTFSSGNGTLNDPYIVN